MKLLLVNYEYPPVGGGAANATQFMGQALVQLGHEVTVLTSGLSENLGLSVEKGVRIHRLATGRIRADRAGIREMMSFLAVSWRAIQCTQSFDATIAFFTIPSGPAALRLFLRARVPYLVSLRGGDVPGHVPGLKLMHMMTRPLRRAVLRRAAAVIANSEGLAATSRAADPFPVHIIPNGVDCERFHPAPDTIGPTGNQSFRVLFVGRVHHEKNLGAVIRQLAALTPEFRARTELLVAGDGAQRPELTALASDLGIASNLRWLGWQAKDALPALYREADVLVNPSHYEGMPNVVLEAMATGLPVIASDVPGNRSVVIPGETGLLFALNRESELAAALSRLLGDPAFARTLGRAGRIRAERDFSWLAAAQSYLELLPPAPAEFPTP